MSKLHTEKRELESKRAAWLSYQVGHPDDTRSADALRSIESQLATVNAQIVFGGGARAMIGQAIGRASAAQRAPRSSSSRAEVAIPNALPDPQRTPQPSAFTSPTDVPWPAPARNASTDRARQNGTASQHSPQVAQPQQSPTVPPPAATPTAAVEQPAATEPPRPFTSPTDVPWPQSKPLPANDIFRSNGR